MNDIPKSAELPVARILNVSDDEYFSDPCSVPSLSQSIAKILITESPLHAWLRHPRLGGVPSESTKATDEGTVIHKLLLGKGTDVVVVDAPDFRTKIAQQARDEATAAGKVPMIRHKYDDIVAAAERLRENCAKQGFHLSGESEVAIEWSEEGEEGPVLCRGRMDHVFIDKGVIYDVKKTASANPKYLARNFVDLGYDIQSAAYPRALEKLRPDLAGRIDFVFLFLELQPPYSVIAARPDGVLREIGAARWSRAVRLWERCLRRNEWPGYADQPITLEAPPWILTQELGA